MLNGAASRVQGPASRQAGRQGKTDEAKVRVDMGTLKKGFVDLAIQQNTRVALDS